MSDDIDNLVEESIRRGPLDSYAKPYSEKCELCGGAWHGIKRETEPQEELPYMDYFDGDCPGAYSE